MLVCSGKLPNQRPLEFIKGSAMLQAIPNFSTTPRFWFAPNDMFCTTTTACGSFGRLSSRHRESLPHPERLSWCLKKWKYNSNSWAYFVLVWTLWSSWLHLHTLTSGACWLPKRLGRWRSRNKGWHSMWMFSSPIPLLTTWFNNTNQIVLMCKVTDCMLNMKVFTHISIKTLLSTVSHATKRSFGILFRALDLECWLVGDMLVRQHINTNTMY